MTNTFDRTQISGHRSSAPNINLIELHHDEAYYNLSHIKCICYHYLILKGITRKNLFIQAYVISNYHKITTHEKMNETIYKLWTNSSKYTPYVYHIIRYVVRRCAISEHWITQARTMPNKSYQFHQSNENHKHKRKYERVHIVMGWTDVDAQIKTKCQMSCLCMEHFRWKHCTQLWSRINAQVCKLIQTHVHIHIRKRTRTVTIRIIT